MGMLAILFVLAVIVIALMIPPAILVLADQVIQ